MTVDLRASQRRPATPSDKADTTGTHGRHCPIRSSCSDRRGHGQWQADLIQWRAIYARGTGPQNPKPSHALTNWPTTLDWSDGLVDAVIYGGVYLRHDVACLVARGSEYVVFTSRSVEGRIFGPAPVSGVRMDGQSVRRLGKYRWSGRRRYTYQKCGTVIHVYTKARKLRASEFSGSLINRSTSPPCTRKAGRLS